MVNNICISNRQAICLHLWSRDPVSTVSTVSTVSIALQTHRWEEGGGDQVGDENSLPG